MITKFETVNYQAFHNQYFQKLREPSCLPKCIEDLCGGWTQETHKQVVQKITKKNQAPLPLFFDKPGSMDMISIKKLALQQTFQLFDSRGIGRIDATELFAMMIMLSKGELQLIFQNVVEIFGQDKSSLITSDEFFFFLDCFFRGVSKICITKNQTIPLQVNKRLNSDDIRDFVQSVFGGQTQLKTEEFFMYLSDNIKRNLNKSKQLFTFFTYIIGNLQKSMEYSREESLKLMKITLEVKKVLSYLIIEVDKTLNPKK